ncbi:UTRA domain-containing protein [Roseomonas elaeocarpi]|uniref:UTRA domain-containing protein n=1 Tax=Roseomonas elaeocarpi TaxID=907779 RepID=A0ABV6JMX6_9PROT
MERLELAGQQPVSPETSLVLPSIAQRILPSQLQECRLQDILMEPGFAAIRQDGVIRADPARSRVADLLQTPINTALLIREARIAARDSTMLVLSSVWYRPEQDLDYEIHS